MFWVERRIRRGRSRIGDLASGGLRSVLMIDIVPSVENCRTMKSLRLRERAREREEGKDEDDGLCLYLGNKILVTVPRRMPCLN